MTARILVSILALAALPGTVFAQFRRMQAPPPPPVPPMGPAVVQYEDFPIHIRVIESRWTADRRLGTYVGWGHADILGPGGQGFEFTYQCNAPFLYNQMKGEFYEASWKKPEEKLDILIQTVGGKHVEKCTLKTSLRPALFSQESLTWEPKEEPPPAAAPSAAR